MKGKRMNKLHGKKIGYKLHKDRNEILAFCASHKRIHLYGMGYVANMLYEYLKEENIEISDVIVGNGHKTTNDFKERYEVFELSQMLLGVEDGIILSVRAEIQDEIREELRKIGINNTQIYGQRIYAFHNHNMPKDISSYILDGNSNNCSYFSQYEELDRLGKIFGTDKSSLQHNYLSKYDINSQ